jgi:PAS domain S-box-containing protein
MGALEFARYALDRSGEQVFWVDPEGRFMSVSDSACEELGYTREELLSMSIFDINPALDPTADTGWETLKNQGTRRFETRNRTKDGRDLPVEVTVQYLVQNGAECSFVVSRDISERKRLEETLRRTQLSLDQGCEQIFWIDPEGRFVFVTDSTCTHLGYSREELLAMSIFDVDSTASTDWDSDWMTLAEQGTLLRQTTHRTKEGSDVPVETSFHHVEYEGNEYAVVFARTIEDTKGSIQQLSESEIQLLQSENLEAVGRLAGGIAHDFNNLLTAIIGYGNLILASEESEGLEALRRDAGEIKGAAERAAALTSQILAFARRQPLHPKVLDLGNLVAGLEERFQPLLGEEIELTILSPDEVGLVEVDEGQLAEAVVNLVKNACEAMPSGGCLTLELKNAELSEEYCKAYPELRPGAYSILSCSDTGVGMDAETKLRIFEPFFTTKPPGEGAGLGLSMVYGTVRQSGGHIVAYSEVGKGTTLKVYLPRVLDSTGVGAVTEQATRSAAGGETIVVVDDEAPLRRLVSRVLGDLGYKVFVAGTGPEALELVEDLESAPDLLVTDVILPGGLQGNELAQKLISAVPDLSVLYMSGHPRDAIMHAGRLDHGVFFLSKPFTPQELAAKVQEVVGSPQTE